MLPETRIALANYDWLVNNRDDVSLLLDIDTVAYGDGGVDISSLMDPDFTPAGRNGLTGGNA